VKFYVQLHSNSLLFVRWKAVSRVTVFVLDVSLDVGQAMLRWVYTDQSDFIHSADDTFVLSLLAVAKTYQLDPLANRQDLF